MTNWKFSTRLFRWETLPDFGRPHKPFSGLAFAPTGLPVACTGYHRALPCVVAVSPLGLIPDSSCELSLPLPIPPEASGSGGIGGVY